MEHFNTTQFHAVSSRRADTAEAVLNRDVPNRHILLMLNEKTVGSAAFAVNHCTRNSFVSHVRLPNRDRIALLGNRNDLARRGHGRSSCSPIAQRALGGLCNGLYSIDVARAVFH